MLEMVRVAYLLWKLNVKLNMLSLCQIVTLLMTLSIPNNPIVLHFYSRR